MKNLFVSMALSLCAFLVSPVLLAQVGNLPGQLFLTGTVGQVSIKDDDALKDDSDVALGFGVGYMVNENLGLEVGYKSLGEYVVEPGDYTTSSGTDFTLHSGGQEVSGFNFGFIGVLPIQGGLDIYGKAGMLRWEDEIEIDLTVGRERIRDDDKDTGTDPYFGFGGKANIAKDISVGLEFMRYKIDDGDVSDTFNVYGGTVFVNL